MKLNKFKSVLVILCLGVLAVSCDTENVEEMDPSLSSQPLLEGIEIPKLDPGKTKSQLPEIDENFKDYIVGKNAVEPSECGPTSFVDVQIKYQQPVINDLYTIFGPLQFAQIFYLYMDLNFYSAYFDQSEDQYFGANGEYTQLVNRRHRDMEKFFDMPNEVRVNGQHTATLNDREKLADIYEIVGTNVGSREQAYAAADQILYFNTFSPHLPDNPFFALDGFATSGNLIVIGDGIVQMLAETGIEEEIVWTGILAHEWAHQIQFNNWSTWYPNGAADNVPEATRYTELEAVFFAGFYMTHKRGATYNWKRVEDFFELFFHIGDCGFENNGHHGTPLQRLEAARLGYELANSAQKQGQILSQEEIHNIFVEQVEKIFPSK
ncbi:MAG TPA: hypothetical protein VK941_05890 [Gillisia sp.]|nr:hypothetical protein [Gillisia sp.]